MLNLKIPHIAFTYTRFTAFLSLCLIALTGCSETLAINEQAKHEFKPPYFGVNLSGAEFNSKKLPGTYNKDYTYPKTTEADYFIEKGMTIFRLPFRWERLQYEMFDEFNEQQLQRIDKLVDHITAKDALVILDPHNYSRYYGNIIGEPEVPVAAFEDFWFKLATHYKNDSRVIFGLMNEPNGMPSELWRDNANAAIAAIRSTGAENLILVPGNGYSGAASWFSSWYGTSNATILLSIVDPIDNYAIEVHQYLDANSSGTSQQCTDAERLATFTRWLKEHKKKAFLGEFGAADSPECSQAIGGMLNHINANLDVWIGWAWWSAGSWWGDYPFSIHPDGGKDKPQIQLLESYMNDAQSKAAAKEY